MFCVSLCDRVRVHWWVHQAGKGTVNTRIPWKMYKESEILFKREFCVDIKVLDCWEVTREEKSLHRFREWVGGTANLAVGSTGTGLTAEKLVIIPLPGCSDSWHCLLLPWLSWPHLAHGRSSLFKPVCLGMGRADKSLVLCTWIFLKAELSLPEICVWKNLTGEFLEPQAKQ